MKLDYSSLVSAVSQLQKSFDYLHSDLARKDAELREQFRAATVQAFEFTYELAIKMIRRQLSLIVRQSRRIARDRLRRHDARRGRCRHCSRRAVISALSGAAEQNLSHLQRGSGRKDGGGDGGIPA